MQGFDNREIEPPRIYDAFTPSFGENPFENGLSIVSLVVVVVVVVKDIIIITISSSNSNLF